MGGVRVSSSRKKSPPSQDKAPPSNMEQLEVLFSKLNGPPAKQEEKASFKKLPQELRDEVYKHYFENAFDVAETSHQPEIDLCESIEGGGHTPGSDITVVSHQVRDETLELYRAAASSFRSRVGFFLKVDKSSTLDNMREQGYKTYMTLSRSPQIPRLALTKLCFRIKSITRKGEERYCTIKANTSATYDIKWEGRGYHYTKLFGYLAARSRTCSCCPPKSGKPLMHAGTRELDVARCFQIVCEGCEMMPQKPDPKRQWYENSLW